MPKLSLAKLERHLYSAADRLRQEGLDAATYKDCIFGMLFLKRSSDVFEAEREKIVGVKVDQGMAKEKAETEYGENPDFYDEFFVPERARWSYLQDKLGDAKEPYGSVLDKALAALAEHNDSLEHVLDHISFMRVQSNKRIVSDDACKDLVRHFSKYRLRNEDFQFSDLLGSAYEFLINMFAESAGKKGGDFYTPRDVIRLMVRILKPRPGLSVYDPCCGSGGMLIISREFIEQSGGDPTNIRLCGQVNDASAWSICKLNMLLHGVPGADIQLQDTLLHPMHREAGELERFDRVIANPPFSQNYTKSNMEFPERFRWGWAPTTGKEGDLMFAQHMLATCKPTGMVTTVMPHGVLFRGGAEKEIRKKFLDQDLIEAIIGLPPNLFYGAGIPACILVIRPNLTGQSPNPNKPENRRGQILFINADAEFHAGRAQNYLRPEHVEKIVSTYDRFEDVPGYARRVPLEEISSPANDWNLNIRRYVDNSPPPEPHDVRAHLLGGVPVAEVRANHSLFEALGFDRTHAFTARSDAPSPPETGERDGVRGNAYFDFAPSLADRSGIRPLVENDPGVQGRVKSLRDALTAWWAAHSARLADLPQHRELNRVRSEFLDSFVAALVPLTTLDRFKLAGVIATWWTETLPDFKTLLENGFPGIIDGWVTPGEITNLKSKYLSDTWEKITTDGLAASAAKLLPVGSVLVTTRATLGEVAIAAVPVATNQGFKSIIPNEKTDPIFAYYCIRSLKQEMERLASGTTFLEISKNDFARIKTCRPPREGQSRIAAVLDAVDEAIAKTEAVIAKLKQVRAGLLHDLLTRGLDLSACNAQAGEHGQLRDPVTHPEQFQDSPLGRMPREWEVVKFEQLATVIDPQPDHRAPPEVSDAEPYVGVGDFLATGGIDLASCRRVSREALVKQQIRFRIEHGDILFGKIGTIGLPRLLPATHQEYALNANTVLIKPTDRSSYVYWLLNSHIIEAQVNTDIHSTSQPVFGIQKIRALIAPSPMISERERVGQVLDGCEKIVRAEETERDKLQEIKSGLMTDLLTGRVRVPEGIVVTG